MIVFILGVSCLVTLFGYLSHTNPPDPTWVDSTIRTLSILGGIVLVTIGMILEFKYLDGKILERLKELMEGGESSD